MFSYNFSFLYFNGWKPDSSHRGPAKRDQDVYVGMVIHNTTCLNSIFDIHIKNRQLNQYQGCNYLSCLIL